jgi:hypothetical protein
MGLENVPRCQHVKMNGTQCGSPALRSRRHCFFHDRICRERAKIAADTSAQRIFDLPLLEDANSIQVAIMKVIQMLGSGRMDHKTAGLILYGLQTASVNLRNAEFEVDEVTDVVIDRDTVGATSIGGQQWFEEDFETDEETAEETEEETEDETDETEATEAHAAGDAPAAGEASVTVGKKAPARAKRLTAEEARMQVQGVIREWLRDPASKMQKSKSPP